MENKDLLKNLKRKEEERLYDDLEKGRVTQIYDYLITGYYKIKPASVIEHRKDGVISIEILIDNIDLLNVFSDIFKQLIFELNNKKYQPFIFQPKYIYGNIILILRPADED